ncbi:phosphoribosylanthranilate isomerase [Candidatus Pelagibacter communis]|uniref:phosphoribosylanthranilate isomerase n=1 Tax=Pelagibacter ubique TaxID=198252 RepID=UPI00092CECDE|nr:phosphoribosylanthranilate isomerase [Candidatus Pelagibacter ubique]
MITRSKICGVSDLDTLKFIINHPYPPQFVGFICNYKKSSRYVEVEKLNELLKLDKKNSNFVAVLVKPDKDILEKIKHLPFDYYQIYDCTAKEIKEIKQKYNKKIITALTIKDETDIKKYQLFSEVTDIYLFDSKGYEKSMGFDHTLIEKIKINKPLMIAGNIQVNDNLEKYKKIADIIDISGGLETSGVKDKSKIDIFLKKVEQVQNET